MILPDSAYIRLKFFLRFKKLPDLKTPKTFNENINVAKRGGNIANNAKMNMEKEINSNKKE